MLLNNYWVTEKIKISSRQYLDYNKCEDILYTNIWNIANLHSVI